MDQPLHHPPQLRRRIPGNHLNITNPCPPQRLLLDRVARSGGVGAFEMRPALILDCVERLAVGIDDQQVDALGIGLR